MHIPKNNGLLNNARKLRRELTPQERRLWYQFLRKYPVKIYKQRIIGSYIVDFYCASAKLVIEIDGSQHYDEQAQAYDARRSEYLTGMGLKVVRYSNADINVRFNWVCESIHQHIEQRSGQTLSAPMCPSGHLSQRERQGTVYALGFFDGVHIGHQALLRECGQLADTLGCEAGVVTFLGHPDTLVSGVTPPLLNTPADRERLLRHYGMDTVVELPFDNALKTMSYMTFFRMLLSRYQAAGLVCGQDFRFGHRGEGTAEKLAFACQDAGIPCTIVPEQRLEGVTVSSTHIRTLLAQGDMEKATAFLGHRHILTGVVVPGQHLGRQLGFPTANLVPPKGLLLPKCGVYSCLAYVDGKAYPAVTNVGSRPTVEGSHITVESWLLDFRGDLYGKELTLEFFKLLREERKFPSLTELQEEIRRNGEETRKFFENT